MKKIILAVILLAAAGGAAYYLLQKKKHADLVSPINKELVTGKWKIDSLDISRTKDSSIALALLVVDSNLNKYEFEIDKKGLIIQSFNGVVEDTSHYKFTSDNQLLVWAKADSAKNTWTINKLDSTRMVLHDIDSTLFSFRKIK